jgi:hypothetical protein
MLLTLYYFACVVYCIVRLYKKWSEQNDIGLNSMELLMVLCIGWVLGPVDFAIISYKHLHRQKTDERIDFKIDKHDNIY